MQWHLATSISSVDADANDANSGVQISLENGESIQADRVLSAVGLRPLTAVAADLVDDAQGPGYAVNEHLQTQDPHVYALGDCANYDGVVRPFVLPIMHGAKALARTLTGDVAPVAFPVMPVVVKTPALPLVVAPPSREDGQNPAGQWQTTATDDGMIARFMLAEAAVGFVLCGQSAVNQQSDLVAEMGTAVPVA